MAAAGDADHRHRQAAETGDQQHAFYGIGMRPAAQPLPEPERHRAEQRPERPAADAAEQDEAPFARADRHHMRRAKIIIAAGQPQRRKAGEDDGGQHDAVGARLVAAAHLLDGEDDAGQRRVEGGGDAGGGAGEDQPAGLRHATEAGDGEHDRRAHLHRRPLTPDRGAAEQADDGEQDLAEGEPQRQQPLAVEIVVEMARGNRLRNAASLGIRKQPRRQIAAEHEAGRRQQERQQIGQRMHRRRRLEQMLRRIRRPREADADHPNRQGPCPEDDPRFPECPGAPDDTRPAEHFHLLVIGGHHDFSTLRSTSPYPPHDLPLQPHLCRGFTGRFPASAD